MNYKKSDIVLVPFPFSDLSSTKRRPALVISPNEYNLGLDVVIAFITSKMDLEYKVGDYKIVEWEKSRLPKPSMIRMKFATIDQSIIIKKLGKLHESDIVAYNHELVSFFTETK